MVVPEAMEMARLEYAANDQVVSLESDVMLSAIFDCECWSNRDISLNLCRGNHYQFDEVGRAK